MPKRSNTKETVLLALELLRRIPRGRKVTAAQLHKQLIAAGVVRELRTIQRQLEMLTEHFGIERDDREKPYGYSWGSQAKGLALPALSEQESLLLMLAERHLQNLLPAPLVQALDGFFTQANTNLGSHGTVPLARQWIAKVRVVSETQRLLPPKLVHGVFATVSEALYANRMLELDYCNADGEQKAFTVMPLGLAQQGARLYLVCRFTGYDDERSLALHRMRSAKVTTLTFEPPKNFDLQKFDDAGGFGFGEGRKIKLTFRIEKERGKHLHETPLSEDQTVKEVDGWLRVSATVIDSGHLDWWLNGFGDCVQDVRRGKLIPTKSARTIKSK